MIESFNTWFRYLHFPLLDTNNRNPVFVIQEMAIMIDQLCKDNKITSLLAEIFVKDLRKLDGKPINSLPQEPCIFAVANWYDLKVAVWDRDYLNCKVYNNGGKKLVYLHHTGDHYDPIVPKTEFEDSGEWHGIADGLAFKKVILTNQEGTDKLIEKLMTEASADTSVCDRLSNITI